ncbi:hypothetical protein Pfo_019397 [Paulownia fortunei]|nr:hypothetical protein Pfo_019397 [Paulownia fortunei]
MTALSPSLPPNAPNPKPPDGQKSFVAVVRSSMVDNPLFHGIRSLKKSFDKSDANFVGTIDQFKGKPTIFYNKDETTQLIAPFNFTLVEKFSHGFPSFKSLRAKFSSLSLMGAFDIGLINSKHILNKLAHEDDFTRIWSRQIWWMDGFQMRVFKWTPEFDVEVESSVAPVWIGFLELPIHLFSKRALYGIASLIGIPLKVDEPTTDHTRPSVARVLYLGIGESVILPKVTYENWPLYCTACKHIGHSVADCYEIGNKPRPPPRGKQTSIQKTMERPTVEAQKDNLEKESPSNGKFAPQHEVRVALENNPHLVKQHDMDEDINPIPKSNSNPSLNHSLEIDNLNVSPRAEGTTKINSSSKDADICSQNRFAMLCHVDNEDDGLHLDEEGLYANRELIVEGNQELAHLDDVFLNTKTELQLVKDFATHRRSSSSEHNFPQAQTEQFIVATAGKKKVMLPLKFSHCVF